MPGLSNKQAAFVQEYLKDLNATQAAIRAGYSPKTANEQAGRLLVKASIQEAIETAKAERQVRTEITQDYVLTSLKTVADRCMEAVPVLVSEGCETGFWKFNAQGANKSLELLGKHLGMFEGKEKAPAESNKPGIIKSLRSIMGKG